jgi:mono/diheme cytochrome c family protein
MAVWQARGWRLAVVAFGLAVPLALSLEPLAVVEPLAAHNPITTKVTWTREISTILERRCVSCHRSGGYAGFALTTYDDARPWAVAIKEVVLAGDMPPWGAAPGIGHFANDRRLTRHEQELVAAWVDGGAPYSLDARTPAFLISTPNSQLPAPRTITVEPPSGGVAIPFAPTMVTQPVERIATVTLQLPAAMSLTAWTFEPGTPFSVDRVDLELGSRWIGTWTPGERLVEFPSDAGAPLTTSALFTARIRYRAPAAGIDYSRLRIWMSKDVRSKTIREVTVVRSWRAPGAVELIALRPARDEGDVEVLARFTNGRAEAIGAIGAPSQGPHPTYRLARPLSLPAGARVETTAPLRLLYTAGATRTVNPNVRTRPRR